MLQVMDVFPDDLQLETAGESNAGNRDSTHEIQKTADNQQLVR